MSLFGAKSLDSHITAHYAEGVWEPAELKPLCENCLTEYCTVVQSTAIAMDVSLVSNNNISYLRTK